MVLQYDEFQRAATEVDRICALPDNSDYKLELQKSAETIPDEKKREFYRHMNSLFLNILLNRLDELGKAIEPKVVNARREIVNILNSL